MKAILPIKKTIKKTALTAPETTDRFSVRDQDAAPGSSTATHTLERALGVLKAFRGSPKPLAHAELVRRTGYSKASISRVAATLVALGYLDRAPDGVRFQIGVRGLRIGHRYLSNSPITRQAKPLMQALADEHNMSIGLAVANQLDMIYIEYCNSSSIATLRLGVGRTVPMELSAIGRTYVWMQSPTHRQRLLFNILKKIGSHGPAVVAKMEEAFEDLERYGYCIAAGEYQRDTFAVSVPVFLGDPPVPMALNCSAVSYMPDVENIRKVLVPSLQNAAEKLKIALSSVDSALF
ncbi:IclR family transcriptional regulator [Herbaspirillum sp. RTI4]|uniref:IclR family transcriptional regulator n=1 Tax=Herbaspirillum sp. RTI4 TaxID=3048640 RepID=UPI002AB45036|nr:IclR family transcriptional regulator [Herbaspirillum sp. RTI4]MDY7579753.1 IclR family transcriptional regulator [Herbaspirillum sp. RTI4]MEA9982727.1 IclR family transcriptional regulator [Herbaspirillum sp. RTI4]